MLNQTSAFETVPLAELEAMTEAGLNVLPFGVVGFARDTRKEVYDATEARPAGISRPRALGAPLFDSIAQYMNNSSSPRGSRTSPTWTTSSPTSGP